MSKLQQKSQKIFNTQIGNFFMKRIKLFFIIAIVTFISVIATFIGASNLFAEEPPTIIFTPSSGTILTRADVDSTLELHSITSTDFFHAIIVDAIETKDHIPSQESSCFYNRKNLLSVSSESIEIIGVRAFLHCSELKFAYFPNAITVGRSAFYGCLNLKEALFPKVIKIDTSGFSVCYRLEFAYFPSLSTVEDEVFGARFDSLLDISFELGTAHTSPTMISFGRYVFSYDTEETEKINLTLGENVLPIYDSMDNIWHTTSGKSNTGTPYKWKSITIVPVSIEEAIKNNSVRVFPNPAGESTTLELEIESACNLQVILTDVLGSDIMEIYSGFADVGTFSQTIPTKHLAVGVYFLKILVGKDYILEKIVVE